jgi:hypothetical protein
MLAVAIVAVGLAAFLGLASAVERARLERLSAEYRRRAEDYVAPRVPAYWRKVGRLPWDRPTSPKGRLWDTLSARERWAVRMADKYREAAERPWLPVEPDPPEPPPE